LLLDFGDFRIQLLVVLAGADFKAFFFAVQGIDIRLRGAAVDRRGLVCLCFFLWCRRSGTETQPPEGSRSSTMR